MKPSCRVHRWRPRGGIPLRDRPRVLGGKTRVAPELFRIPTFDPAKATELAFIAIEIAVVIGVARDLAVQPDPVNRFHPLHHLNGERQASQPRPALLPVTKVEASRGRISDPRLRA